MAYIFLRKEVLFSNFEILLCFYGTLRATCFVFLTTFLFNEVFLFPITTVFLRLSFWPFFLVFYFFLIPWNILFYSSRSRVFCSVFLLRQKLFHIAMIVICLFPRGLSPTTWSSPTSLICWNSFSGLGISLHTQRFNFMVFL